MPLCDKSLRDWVAKMTATFDLRSTLSHSRKLGPEGGVSQHDPGFIQHQQGRLPLKTLFKPVKQVSQDRQNNLLAARHQVFKLKHLEDVSSEVRRSRHPAAARADPRSE
jgi:hypothetical protein